MTTPRECVQQNALFTKSRLISLYSDFSKLKEANPEGFEANLIAWKSLINDLFHKCCLQNRFVLVTDGLIESLVLPDFGKPLAVNVPLDALLASEELIPLKAFKERKDGLYAKKWVKPMLSWTINKFIIDTSYKIGDKNHTLKSDNLVSKPYLESYSKELLNRLDNPQHTNTVFTKPQLFHYINQLEIRLYGVQVELTMLDFEILLQYLERDLNKIKVSEDIIKVGTEDITEEDISIAEIKGAISLIESKNAELQEKISKISIRLKESLNKNKSLSLNLLKSRKIAESALSKQISSLNQLESVMYKIDESSTNLQLISAIEKGSSILKVLNKQIGGIERVEEIMNELNDEKYEVDQVSKQLATFEGQVDDEDIELEFQELLENSKPKPIAENKEQPEDEDVLKKLESLKIANSEIVPQPSKQDKQEQDKEEPKPIAN